MSASVSSLDMQLQLSVLPEVLFGKPKPLLQATINLAEVAELHAGAPIELTIAAQGPALNADEEAAWEGMGSGPSTMSVTLQFHDLS